MSGREDRAQTRADHRVQIRFLESEMAFIRRVQEDYNCSMSEAAKILMVWGWESAGYDEEFLYESD